MMPIIHSNIIFQEAGYVGNPSISSPFRRKFLYSYVAQIPTLTGNNSKGPSVMITAEEFAKKLHDEFVCGAVLTEIFKLRISVSFWKVGGAARGVNIDTATEYITVV